MNRLRSMPTVPVTTAIGCPICSSTGPCSMCSSRYAAMVSRRFSHRSNAFRCTPCSANVSTSPALFLSFKPASTSRSRLPATAAEPNKLRPNRAPSSSAQSTSAIVRAGFGPSHRALITSRPAITPSAPSSQPPLGTESRCEPITIVSSDSPRK